ncbi:MAG: hypothetical protein DRQ14_09215 [Candidatus Latescibacterota bacterium]|nr:MAG: hypothetical protein DRQ14_09215 [Candidatus Latescibacterota bacterium]
MHAERMRSEGVKTLKGRKLYIPRMPYGGAKLMAAVFRSIGIDAEPVPPSDERTRELGRKYTGGDECYPEQVTLGDFLKIAERPDFDPSKTAFFMATSTGPCRFGQYVHYQRKVFRELGYGDVMFFSPSSSDAYEGLAEGKRELMRTGWWAVVSSDILMKMLLKTRPYELNKGDTDRVYEESLEDVSRVLEKQDMPPRRKLGELVDALTKARDKFRAIPADYDPEVPLIGVVGEIFCRLNTFSNEDLVRKIEEGGGECWLSDVSEWIWYTNSEQRRKLIASGKRLSLEMFGFKVKVFVQKRDEEKLLEPFKEEFRGYEEPDVEEVLEYARPYLPYYGALGEMVLSVGKAVYLYHKGADGIVDISPFSCMNGIVCEAVYPDVSRDHDGIPIRTFYFDGTQTEIERDVGIFLELARAYKRRKRVRRVYPSYFKAA